MRGSEKILSYDEIVSAINEIGCEWEVKKYKETLNSRLFQEAKDNDQCGFVFSYDNIVIIIKESSLIKNNGAYEWLGYYVHPFANKVHVWEATRCLDRAFDCNIHDGKGIGEYSEDISVEDLIAKVEHDADVCPNCGKKIGIHNMEHYFFAGRCCPDCLPELKEKYETKGWYN